MIELILIIALLFVLGLVGLIHFVTTSSVFTNMFPETQNDNGPSIHPWFIAVEAILAVTIVYIVQKGFFNI